MKKSLIVLAILGAVSGSVVAQSNVQVFGVVDGGVRLSKAQSQSTKVQMSSGFAIANRWGIKGVEDLGNGLKVGFVLEQGFTTNNGQPAAMSKNDAGVPVSGTFNRESRLYIQGDFGQVGFGRYLTLNAGAGVYCMTPGNLFAQTYLGFGSWSTLATNFVRANNAVAYLSPDISGLKVAAMYSNGLYEDGEKWSENKHYYGVGSSYKAGAFSAGLVLEASTYADKSNMDDTMTATIGGSYDFGVLALYGNYQYAKDSHHFNGYGEVGANTKKGADLHLFGLGVSAPMAGGTAKLGARYLTGESQMGAKEDMKAWNLIGAYAYPLSKRTTIHAMAGYVDGDKALAKNASLNGWNTYIGLAHFF